MKIPKDLLRAISEMRRFERRDYFKKVQAGLKLSADGLKELKTKIYSQIELLK